MPSTWCAPGSQAGKAGRGQGEAQRCSSFSNSVVVCEFQVELRDHVVQNMFKLEIFMRIMLDLGILRGALHYPKVEGTEKLICPFRSLKPRISNCTSCACPKQKAGSRPVMGQSAKSLLPPNIHSPLCAYTLSDWMMEDDFSAHEHIGISIFTNNDLSTDFSLSRVPGG